MSDLRVMRERQAIASSALDRSGDLDTYASSAAIVQTTTVMTYPTNAAGYYACAPQQLTGSIVEGGAATYSAYGSTLYALNVGSQIPPVGTYLVVHSVGGRWAFRFDG